MNIAANNISKIPGPQSLQAKGGGVIRWDENPTCDLLKATSLEYDAWWLLNICLWNK